jgi:uncharacterized paraquat-inducible protein A
MSAPGSIGKAEGNMRVDVYRCPSCAAWVVIPPLQTEDRRIKRCNNCNANLWFTNNELKHREVSEELARRKWFLDSEIKPSKSRK